MPRRTCPACARRTAGLVSPDCPVCDGVGVIGLGAAALHAVGGEPVVVARAIELALEAAAREAIAAHAPGGPERLDELAAAVARLRDARIITAPLGVAEPETTNPDAPAGRALASLATLAATRLADARPTAADHANLDAAPVRYGIHDRPRAYGQLPTTSRAGYQSALARVTDPTDALGPDTRALVYRDQAEHHAARVLCAALDPAITFRIRKGDL